MLALLRDKLNEKMPTSLDDLHINDQSENIFLNNYRHINSHILYFQSTHGLIPKQKISYKRKISFTIPEFEPRIPAMSGFGMSDQGRYTTEVFDR